MEKGVHTEVIILKCMYIDGSVAVNGMVTLDSLKEILLEKEYKVEKKR